MLADRSEAMNLTDIGIDCLEQTFVKLEFKDLLSVADVNQQFRKAAIYAFNRKYSQKKFHINGNRKKLQLVDELDGLAYYIGCKGLLYIPDLKTIAQTLRCFGTKIFDITFFYGAIPFSFDESSYSIFNYINRYCSDSLTKINLFSAECIEDINLIPFSNVENVGIEVYYFRNLSLNRIFPKMQKLRIANFKPNQQPFIVEHFPHLKHLKVHMDRHIQDFDTAVVTILQLNQQIQTLTMRGGNFSFLEQLSSHTQSLEHFDYCAFINQFSHFHDKPIYFPNVQVFSFGSHWEKCLCNELYFFPRIPFRFDQLKVFVLKNEFIFSSTFHTFIKQHRTIEKLVFEQRFSFNKKYNILNKYAFLSKSMLQEFLPLLNEIVLDSRNIHLSIDEVLGFMKKIQSLKYFSFNCLSSKDDINKYCGDDFNILHIKPISHFFFVKIERN